MVLSNFRVDFISNRVNEIKINSEVGKDLIIIVSIVLWIVTTYYAALTTRISCKKWYVKFIKQYLQYLKWILKIHHSLHEIRELNTVYNKTEYSIKFLSYIPFIISFLMVNNRLFHHLLSIFIFKTSIYKTMVDN